MLRINQVTAQVTHCDEASRWYIEKLGFVRRQYETYADGARWCSPSPPPIKQNSRSCSTNDLNFRRTRESASQLSLMIETDVCVPSFETLKAQGVHFNDPPVSELWGITTRLIDIHVNKLHMYQPPNGGT